VYLALNQVPWCVRHARLMCFSHIFRESNHVAYALSMHALDLDVSFWWSNTLAFCSSLVGNNCMGRESFRFC
jgi:hypothetical protein